VVGVAGFGICSLISMGSCYGFPRDLDVLSLEWMKIVLLDVGTLGVI
jgi:hypothetical protein